MKKKVLKVIADMAYATSKKEADSACRWVYHQPELPEKVKKLRKW